MTSLDLPNWEIGSKVKVIKEIQKSVMGEQVLLPIGQIGTILNSPQSLYQVYDIEFFDTENKRVVMPIAKDKSDIYLEPFNG